MQTFEIGRVPAGPGAHDEDAEEPFLEFAGVEGSILRATPSGLTVCPCRSTSTHAAAGHRHWSYDQLGDVRLDTDGTVGVIRARILSSGTLLPLLLLESHQIASARRTLEIVQNLMGPTRTARLTA